MPRVLLAFFYHHAVDMLLLAGFSLIQALGLRAFLRSHPSISDRARRAVYGLALLTFGLDFAGFAIEFSRVRNLLPDKLAIFLMPVSLNWAVYTVVAVLLRAIYQRLPRPQRGFSPSRRLALKAFRASTFLAPAAAIGYGIFIERNQVQLREQSIAIPGLHPDLDGLRLVQLSDIHLSPFLSVRQLERAAAMANEARAHIALVTGDLITLRGDPLDDCIDRLKLLRADAGVFGCMGNHEVYAVVEDYVAERGAEAGMRFLRGTSEPLRFGNATLNLAGVDYQRMHSDYLVGAERMIRPNALNVLLSHNPDVFPVAAAQGWQFTIAGHTHGGQVNFEILRQDLNIARFFTPYTVGLYRREAASIYVSRGIGTIGMPLRLGSAPEVAVLKLCRT